MRPAGRIALRHPGLLLLVLLGLAGCDRAPRLAPLAGDAVILAFGDSLTFGSGAGAEQSYPAQLGQLSGRQVVRSGVPGELSDAGLARLPAELAAHRPALLLLCHGGNDLLRKQSRAQLAANLRAMVALARAQGVAVVLIGVPRPGLLLGTDPLYRELADELDLPLEDEALAQILADSRLKSDAVHPNALGYRQLAARVHDLLRGAGAL